ncbi:MAG: GDP-mannose 4,6-dehydratase [Chloroflexota bacterium]|nr:GDP-mannose 4,6-dehydratase [Chloroflexota bacterium]
MQALITGIAGFAGSHLADYLLRHTDYAVAGTIHRQDGRVAHLRDHVAIYRADLRDPAAVAEIVADVRPDLIFHLAAQSFVPLSWQHPWTTFEQNVQGQVNVLQAVSEQQLSARVLVVGSNEEYGLIDPDDLPVDEATPLRPISPYGVSKVAQDLMGWQYYRSYGMEVIRVRPFNHIGPRQGDRFVAPAFARQIAEVEAGLREPIVRVGNLTARRDFTDVRDVVRAYWLILAQGEPGGVYNIGSGSHRSIEDLLNVLLSFSEVDISVQRDAARMRPSDVPVSVSDNKKLVAATGWQPEISFEQSLRDILKDWRQRLR